MSEEKKQRDSATFNVVAFILIVGLFAALLYGVWQAGNQAATLKGIELTLIEIHDSLCFDDEPEISDMGQESVLEIPVSSFPAPRRRGEVVYDTTDDVFEVYDGSEVQIYVKTTKLWEVLEKLTETLVRLDSRLGEFRVFYMDVAEPNEMKGE